ncbi:MAG: hypothetical protein HQL50_04695 [Magnetococcales bacterium]|nr:hypothetical protein [Magnetococcales bacterium]
MNSAHSSSTHAERTKTAGPSFDKVLLAQAITGFWLFLVWWGFLHVAVKIPAPGMLGQFTLNVTIIAVATFLAWLLHQGINRLAGRRPAIRLVSALLLLAVDISAALTFWLD